MLNLGQFIMQEGLTREAEVMVLNRQGDLELRVHLGEP